MATGNENAFTVSPSLLYDALRTKSAHLFGTCARCIPSAFSGRPRANAFNTHRIKFYWLQLPVWADVFNGISKRRELRNVVRKLFSMLYWPRLNVRTIVWWPKHLGQLRLEILKPHTSILTSLESIFAQSWHSMANQLPNQEVTAAGGRRWRWKRNTGSDCECFFWTWCFALNPRISCIHLDKLGKLVLTFRSQ